MDDECRCPARAASDRCGQLGSSGTSAALALDPRGLSPTRGGSILNTVRLHRSTRPSHGGGRRRGGARGRVEDRPSPGRAATQTCPGVERTIRWLSTTRRFVGSRGGASRPPLRRHRPRPASYGPRRSWSGVDADRGLEPLLATSPGSPRRGGRTAHRPTRPLGCRPSQRGAGRSSFGRGQHQAGALELRTAAGATFRSGLGRHDDRPMTDRRDRSPANRGFAPPPAARRRARDRRAQTIVDEGARGARALEPHRGRRSVRGPGASSDRRMTSRPSGASTTSRPDRDRLAFGVRQGSPSVIGRTASSRSSAAPADIASLR